MAAAARCRGLLAGAHGDVDGALARLRDALDLHERVPIPLELARSRLAYGSALRRARQKAAARAELEAAAHGFDAVGARVWAGRARAELARVGGRPPSSGALTPTERRVAELVAQGLQTKQVAARLFVSPKTVEGHLSRIYGKLGIGSRTELAHRLGAPRARAREAPRSRLQRSSAPPPNSALASTFSSRRSNRPPLGRSPNMPDELVNVRYMVDDVESAVAFYTAHFGFAVRSNAAPAFADVVRGNLRLLLSGPASSAGRPMPDGRTPQPGGWNRIHFVVDDIGAEVERLRAADVTFRNDIISGPGGRQILLEDPAGNPIELFQPAGAYAVAGDARVGYGAGASQSAARCRPSGLPREHIGPSSSGPAD